MSITCIIMCTPEQVRVYMCHSYVHVCMSVSLHECVCASVFVDIHVIRCIHMYMYTCRVIQERRQHRQSRTVLCHTC